MKNHYRNTRFICFELFFVCLNTLYRIKFCVLFPLSLMEKVPISSSSSLYNCTSAPGIVESSRTVILQSSCHHFKDLRRSESLWKAALWQRVLLGEKQEEMISGWGQNEAEKQRSGMLPSLTRSFTGMQKGEKRTWRMHHLKCVIWWLGALWCNHAAFNLVLEEHRVRENRGAAQEGCGFCWSNFFV